jgi:hypothetical protein
MCSGIPRNKTEVIDTESESSGGVRHRDNSFHYASSSVPIECGFALSTGSLEIQI